LGGAERSSVDMRLLMLGVRAGGRGQSLSWRRDGRPLMTRAPSSDDRPTVTRSTSDRLAAVDVQRLPRDEGGPVQVQNPLDDIGDLTHAPQGMQTAQPRAARRIVRG